MQQNIRKSSGSIRMRKKNVQGLKDIFFSPISVMLVCVPLGIISSYAGFGDKVTFWLNFFAMIPLAKILGDATEQLADQLQNDMISGLLNATFGNAVEMIMTITLLQNAEYVVIKATMLGSVLSNMLLVLGMSFLAGGFVKTKPSGRTPAASREPLLAAEPFQGGQIDPREQEQAYSTLGAMVNTTMLLLCCLILCLVTVFDHTSNTGGGSSEAINNNVLSISRKCSVLIVMAYVAYIIFELFTHRGSIAESDSPAEVEAQAPATGKASVAASEAGEEGELSLTWSIGLLVGATVVVAVCSEFLTNALEGALAGSGMGKEFLGIILLPIVGNACEHAAAVRFAAQDKPGLAVGIAIGSSVQIALFVVPFSVLVGAAMGDDATGHNMDLNFGALNVVVLTMSVLVVLAIVVDGKSNWLEGYLLCTAYVMIAVLYWFVPDQV